MPVAPATGACRSNGRARRRGQGHTPIASIGDEESIAGSATSPLAWRGNELKRVRQKILQLLSATGHPTKKKMTYRAAVVLSISGQSGGAEGQASIV